MMMMDGRKQQKFLATGFLLLSLLSYGIFGLLVVEDEESEEGVKSPSRNLIDLLPNENAATKEENKIVLASCEVFDPFKVLPAESDHFQIGGAFPLHNPDCLTLVPSSVQDVVAIQWALAYWNENSSTKSSISSSAADGEENERRRPKIGLFAGDSCTRPKEAISQSLRFLDSVGYHEPSECLPSVNAARKGELMPKLIALLAPKDGESASQVAQSLAPSGLPIGVFSTAAAEAFLDANVQGFISTAPFFDNYVDALAQLVRATGSDLVSIVDWGDDDPSPSSMWSTLTTKLVDRLRTQHGISIADVIAFGHPMLATILDASDAQIIVSMVPNRVLQKAGLGELKALREMKKYWVTLDTEMGGEGEIADMMDFLGEVADGEGSPKLQFITIRRRQRQMGDYNAYFLRVLLTNYEYYSLLHSYVRQVYNCTGGSKGKQTIKSELPICNDELLSPKRLAQLHKQSATIEPSILLVYAFARTAQKINSDPILAEKCAKPGSQYCYNAIRTELLDLSSPEAEAEYDLREMGRLPPGFGEQIKQMKFFEKQNGILQLVGITLETVMEEREGRDGTNIFRLMEYQTSPNKTAGGDFHLPQRLRNIRSLCRPFRAFCGDKCELATQRPEDQTFLSIPQQYSLYLTALFDFQGGPNCNQLRRENPASVALPLAFVYTMSTFRQRHTAQSALFISGATMDIGALLVDTCSNGRTLMEFLVDSERNCFRFSQVERNWTITSGATIGYVYGAETATSVNEAILQAIFGHSRATPVVGIGINEEKNEWEEGDSALFTLAPSHRSMAAALIRFLKRMHWTYVNVVLDRSDSYSMAIYEHFELLSAGGGICTAQLTIIGSNQNGRERSRRHSVSKGGQQASSAADQFGGFGRPAANVSIVFGSAKQTAEYMSARLRDEVGGGLGNLHIMVGDAHDFHLYDRTNLARYTGTVSFQAKDVSSGDFYNWLHSITPLTLPEAWYWRHVEENWHCALSKRNIARFNGRLCSGEELLDVKRMGRLTKAGYLAQGVDQLLIAVDLAHKKLCSKDEKPCDEFLQNGRSLIREILAKNTRPNGDEFEVYELLPADHQGNFGWSMWANYSTLASSNQFRFLTDYRPFANGIALPTDSKPIMSKSKHPFCACSFNGNNRRESLFGGKEELEEVANNYIRREPARGVKKNNQQIETGESAEDKLEMASSASWVDADDPEVQNLDALGMERELDDLIRTIFFVLAALLCALAVGTLLLIALKMYQRKVRGHQSLGILLLCGIIALYSGGMLFALRPDKMICHLRIAVHALGHSLCLGVIIVKAIQLRNAEALALMGATVQQISYWNYWLLLFFIVAVQSVICVKWLLLDPLWSGQLQFALPFADNRLLLCSYSSPNFLLSQCYTFVLLLLALLLSAQNRNIKRNYREAKWLFVTSFCCAIILCCWAACHAFLNPLYLDHISILELLLTATLLLAFVFGPKLYVLLFYEPVIVECVYGGNGSAQVGDGGMKSMMADDLFETGWAAASGEIGGNNSQSPTMSTENGSEKGAAVSRLNSENWSGRRNNNERQQQNDEAEEKVSDAFQTVLRKKKSSRAHSSVERLNLNTTANGMCSPNASSGRSPVGSQSGKKTKSTAQPF